jgi:hypothetical protein
MRHMLHSHGCSPLEALKLYDPFVRALLCHSDPKVCVSLCCEGFCLPWMQFCCVNSADVEATPW